MTYKITKLFLRLALATAFISAVADRFGLWPPELSNWGTWDSFLSYTGLLLPWFSDSIISVFGFIATAAEIIFGLALLLGFKTELFAKLSGFLLLAFALAMVFTVGIKSAFDYSVFTASAAAFALSQMKEKYLEIDA